MASTKSSRAGRANPIYSVIAVPADSPVKTLKDLTGKRVAFPSKEALAGYAAPMVALQAAKVKVEPVLAGNQEGTLAQLRARQVDAASVNSRFLTQYAAQHAMPYREMFTSDGFAELPVIIHPRIPQADTAAIQKALLGMKNDPKAAAALEASGASASTRPPTAITTTPAGSTRNSLSNPAHRSHRQQSPHATNRSARRILLLITLVVGAVRCWACRW